VRDWQIFFVASMLTIKPHHPWWFRVRVGLIVMGLAGVFWGGYEYGHFRAGYDNHTLLEERVTLRVRLAEQQKESRRLRVRIAILERTGQVDKKGYSEVEHSLKQAQNAMLALKQEVAFYRGIVAPAEAASGLGITSFQVTDIGGERAYRFKLVMTQLKTNNRMVKGDVRISLEGVRNGQQERLGLKEISGGALDKLKLRFKYFQNIEGEIVLPEGFLPSRVRVEVVPVGKGWTRFKKTFDWSDG
jgi:hypothetical protein